MPELPEVETVRRGLLSHLEGQQINDVYLRRLDLRYPFGSDFEENIKAQRILRLHRRGKYFWAELDKAGCLMMHLGMSGSFKIIDAKTNSLRDESLYSAHDHAAFLLSNDKILIYNDPRRFGFLLYLQNLDEYKPFQLMGPEPLSNHFSGPILYEALKKRQSPIKTTLLDQSIVSGLGNIYVCEALYLSGINPKRKANKISKEKCDVLAGHIKEVLQKAIEAGGSSLRDHKQVDGSTGYFQHQFNVYDREGKPCQICDNPTHLIKRITQAGRSSFYCPHHQR